MRRHLPGDLARTGRSRRASRTAATPCPSTSAAVVALHVSQLPSSVHASRRARRWWRTPRRARRARRCRCGCGAAASPWADRGPVRRRSGSAARETDSAPSRTSPSSARIVDRWRSRGRSCAHCSSSCALTCRPCTALVRRPRRPVRRRSAHRSIAVSAMVVHGGSPRTALLAERRDVPAGTSSIPRAATCRSTGTSTWHSSGGSVEQAPDVTCRVEPEPGAGAAEQDSRPRPAPTTAGPRPRGRRRQASIAASDHRGRGGARTRARARGGAACCDGDHPALGRGQRSQPVGWIHSRVHTKTLRTSGDDPDGRFGDLWTTVMPAVRPVDNDNV